MTDTDRPKATNRTSGVPDPDIEEWAAREHKRRQAWLAGPTEAEKRGWARQYRARYRIRSWADPLEPDLTDEDVEQWAEREHKRRQAWAAGPTEAEMDNLAASPTAPWRSYTSQPGAGARFADAVDRLRSETYLAAEAMWGLLAEDPYRFWASFMDAGRSWDAGYTRPTRRRRIPLYDD